MTTSPNARVAAERLVLWDIDLTLIHAGPESGAYGTDGHVRAHLVDLARQRAHAKYGITFDAAGTVLIGDTPHDVSAGREGGALVVAVATGRSSEAELREAGADLVLPDLRDMDALLRAVAAGRA